MHVISQLAWHQPRRLNFKLDHDACECFPLAHITRDELEIETLAE